MRIPSVVVLVACASGTRDATPPPRPVPADAAIDAAPIDAAVDAAVVAWGACDWNKPDPRNPRCAPEHMPLMRCRDVNGPSTRFPKCRPDNEPDVKVEPIVLAIKKRGGMTKRGVPVIARGGTTRGIDDTWFAELLDAGKKPISRGTLECVRFEADELECLSTLPSELVAKAKSVRFTPPPSPPAVTERSFVMAIGRLGDVTANGLVVVVAGGTGHGIDKTWRADLVGADMRALPKGRFTYVRLDEDEIEGLVQMTKDQAERARGVRFTPP